MIRFPAGALLALLLLPGLARAVPADDRELANKLERYVASFAEPGYFSGVVLVERGGRTVFARAYGEAERSFGAPVTMDTRFQIASLSKPMTAAAIARLVDRGKLTFETPISAIVDGVPNGDRITIEHLLTHHSGLDSPDRLPGSQQWMRFPQTPASLVERIRPMATIAQPGEKYSYANANYWLLALVIEKVSGVPYGEFLKREIFDPLGMKDTAHRADFLQTVPRLATGYQPEGMTGFRTAELVDWTSKTGNGSIYSTAADVMKFYHGIVDGHLLSAATTQRVLGLDRTLGFGWFVRKPDKYGRRSVFFNGRSPGYTSYLEGFVDDDTSFVILSNYYVYAPTVMAEGIGAILWDKPYEPQAHIRVMPTSRPVLAALEGVWQFAPDFFVPNGRARLVAKDGYLEMRWEAGGLVTMLWPTGEGRYLDPTFWATLEFAGEGPSRVMQYRAYGFPKVHEARPVADSLP